MKIQFLKLSGVSLVVLLFGCQKKEVVAEPLAPVATKPATEETMKAAVAAAPAPSNPKVETLEVVKETERSRHFLAVTRHLEIGGTLYGYVDIDGDAQKLAGSLQELLTEIAKTQPQATPFLQQDYTALFQILGLNDVKALGLSSVPDGTGFFRNRVFFYTPEQRHGLLEGLGGEVAPLVRLQFAPADTDLYSEGEVDLAAVYKTINQVVAKVGGEETALMLDGIMEKFGQEAGISLLKIVQSWKGRMSLVMRLEDKKSVRWPGGKDGVELPAFSLLLSIDGVAPALREALIKLPVFKQRQEGLMEIFEFSQPLPIAGLSPVLVIEGSTLMLATSPAYLTESRATDNRLAQSEEFKKSLAPYGTNANGLMYVNPHFFKKVYEIGMLNPRLLAESNGILELVLNKIPQPDRPLVAVRTNLPDGILIQSSWNRSLKQDVAVLAFYNPVTVGVLAAMAFPAFQKVRTSSQEQTVLNNLRQLSAAADQYYLEYGKIATYDDLVGPDRFISELTPVAGENYRLLQFYQNQPLVVRLSTGRLIRYPAK